MKTQSLLTGMLVLSLFTQCRKERGGPFEKETYDYRCDIVMGHDTLLSYSMYDDIRDTLLYRTDYHYAGNRITEISSRNGLRLYSRVYITDGAGAAMQAWDTLANGETRYIEYERTLPQQQKEHVKYKTASGDSGTYGTTYFNFGLQVQITPYGKAQSCSDYYNLSARRVNVNVLAFEDRIKRLLPDELPSFRQYMIDCPQTPQSAPAQSNYQYMVNAEGNITVLYDIYTPAFNVTKTRPRSTIKKTRYTYTIR